MRSLSLLQLLPGLPLGLLPWGFHQRARSVGPLAYPRPFSVNDLLFHRYLTHEVSPVRAVTGGRGSLSKENSVQA